MLQNRRNVGGDEKLAVAQPDDNRRAFFDGDHGVGFVGVNDRKREDSVKLFDRLAHRFLEIAPVF
jgi:hypothetical protein